MDHNNPIRVMIVDDHEMMREGLALIIGSQPGMTVVAEAGSGLQAFEMFRLHAPDVTLMDLRMPGMSGVDVIRTIRGEFPRSRFIVLTTYDDDEDIHSALQAGAQAYLLKGMSRNDLLNAIRAVHAGLRHIPEVVQKRMEEHIDHDLTAREIKILKLLAEGRSNKEIASDLRIAEGTVKWYVNTVVNKLGVNDRTHAVVTALRRGIIQLD